LIKIIKIKVRRNKEKEIEMKPSVVKIHFLSRKKFIQNTKKATNSPLARLINFFFRSPFDFILNHHEKIPTLLKKEFLRPCLFGFLYFYSIIF